jgi:hypothetical protein
MNIITTIRVLLGRVSTEKAIAGFTKAAAQLDAVIQIENTKIDNLDAAIDRAAKNRLDAFARRDRAKTIADRVNALVS